MKENVLKLKCQCGADMHQVVTYETPDKHPVRCGWFCIVCRAWVKAVQRERVV
jgi:hypothetical protein